MRSVAVCVTVATSLMTAFADSAAATWTTATSGATRWPPAPSPSTWRVLAGDDDPEEVFTCRPAPRPGQVRAGTARPPRVCPGGLRARRAAGPLVEAEREAFGFDHAARARFRPGLALPRVLCACFGRHHRARGDRGPTPRGPGRWPWWPWPTTSPTPWSRPRSDLGFDPRHVDAERLHAAAGLTARAGGGRTAGHAGGDQPGLGLREPRQRST